MYIPKLFRNDNLDEVRDFIAAHGFATLVNQTSGRLWATHIPLLAEHHATGKDSLHGHMAKANPQWREFENGAEVLAIFQGPHTYISSSWYDHENVPTWNYIAVHVYGKIRILNAEELLASLSKLVDKYEAGSENPVSVKTMSPEVLRENLHGVVGFEIEITEIHSAKKLSQNRDDKNHHEIMTQLKKRDPDAQAIAREMQDDRTNNLKKP